MATTFTHDPSSRGEGATNDNEFAQRVLDILNSGALTLMISIGHRTGLFDTMAALPPARVEEIARRAQLNERYVREWLGAMVTGRIVTFDPETERYHLPAEHAAALTRESPSNVASTAQWMAVLGSVETEIVDRFRQGGGVPYECYCRFHEVMAEESAQTVVAGLHDYILPLVPGLIDKLTAGIEVMDVGCGRGRALQQLAEAFPASRFTGYDLCADAIQAGREETRGRGLHNLTLEAADVAQLHRPAAFDLITAFDAIHDQAQPARVLQAIAESLRPDGVFLMQDIAASSHLERNLEHPIAPLIYTISCMHCMSVSLAQGGAGLGAAWGRELACQMLADAGFRNVTVHQLDHDMLNYYYIARRT